MNARRGVRKAGQVGRRKGSNRELARRVNGSKVVGERVNLASEGRRDEKGLVHREECRGERKQDSFLPSPSLPPLWA